MMTLVRKFQVKLFTESTKVDLKALVPVFHAWIRTNKITDELLIDVADYAHVPQGPGVVLIGHQSDYYLDLADDRPGLLYSRKRGFDGSVEDGIEDAFTRAIGASRLLEAEPTLDFSFRTDEFLFRVQDRLLAPNSDAGFARIEQPLAAVAKRLFDQDIGLVREGGPRDPLTVRVHVGRGALRAAG